VVEILRPDKNDTTAALNMLRDKVVMLIAKWWDSTGRIASKDRTFSMDHVSFTQLWMDRRMIILVNKDDATGKYNGIVCSIALRSVFTNDTIENVELFYGETPAVQTALFDKLYEIASIRGASLIQLPKDVSIGNKATFWEITRVHVEV